MASTPDFPTKFDLPVPRYTSFPTAPQFHAGIGPEIYRDWLGRLAPEEPVSLYLHVPFCRELCWYCGCNTHVASRYRPVADYRDLLLAEVDRIAAALPARLKANRIHWGGGTPTILSPADFRAVQDRLRRCFDIGEDAEVAVEIDPRVLDAPMIAALSQSGVTRASLGVQDFDSAVQRAVNRWQPYEVTKRTVEGLREAGIAAINLDLIYGLPYQTVDSVLATIEQAHALGPQRIALFGYAHVPWLKPHQKLLPAAALPDSRARWSQSMAAARRLQELGYSWIGLDHFALPKDAMAEAARAGRLRRNFQGYTTDSAQTLLGFGASSISALPQGYVQNAAEVKAWQAALQAGSLPVTRGIALSAEDRLRRHVIERLMCDLEVDLDAAAQRFGEASSFFAPERLALAELAGDDLVEIEGGRIRLTGLGRPLMRVVAAVFDRYLDPMAGRHARAV
jgi:oxygen-independent coproporphyrinogen-3 oxidase